MCSAPESCAALPVAWTSPVVAPVSRITLRLAMASPSACAFSPSAVASSADPITPTLIFISASSTPIVSTQRAQRISQRDAEDLLCVLCGNLRALCVKYHSLLITSEELKTRFLPIPPPPCQKPNQSR